MKLFKSGSGKSKQLPEPAQKPPPDVSSIGSELSSRDQFDIVVRRQLNAVTANRTLSRSDPQKLRGAGLFGYFNNDDIDHSTVSSITVEEHKKFGLFPKNRGFAQESSSSSWCCCSDNTAPTEYTADHNTLMHSARSVRSAHAGDAYTQARYRAITQQQQQLQARQSWLATASCAPMCGAEPEPLRVTKSRRPRLFRRQQPNTITSNKSSKSMMSSSLFDTLTEDWDDEDGGRRLGSVRRKSQLIRKSLTLKRGKQQAV